VKITKEQSREQIKEAKPAKTSKWKDSKSKIRSKEKEKKKEEKANSRKSGSGPLLGSSGATDNSNRPSIEDVPFTPVDTNALFQKYRFATSHPPGLCATLTDLWPRSLRARRVLGMCGIVLSVKAQQQYFDNTKVRHSLACAPVVLLNRHRSHVYRTV
jgi:hypothetical protein